MKTVFETFSATAGWSGSTTPAIATIHGTNTMHDYLAGDQTASLIFKFAGVGAYVEKTPTTPISTVGYNEIIIWVWSQTKGTNEYITKDDFSYKISFGTSKEYYMPAFETFHYFVIDCSAMTTIDKIKITSLTADTDYLIMSYGVLAIDELPLDIFVGIKEKLDNLVTARLATTFTVGSTGALTAGASSMTLTGASPWIDRYMVVKITGADSGGTTHTEYHTIATRNNLTFTFLTTWDGSTLKYSYVSSTIYVYIPVNYGRRQTEIELPSIAIWGLDSEKYNLTNQLSPVIDSWKTDDTIGERREGFYSKFPIVIDCEARQDELLASITNIVRRVLSDRIFYCNGRSVDIDFQTGRSVEVEPNEAFNIIPKVQYTAEVIIQEELYNRTYLPTTKTIDADFIFE